MSLPARTLDDRTFVTPQITLASLPAFAAEGVVAVMSHRPDGEDPGQPTAAEVEAAAAEAGLRFIHAPVQGFPDAAAVAATGEVLASLGADEKVLMFCRSGTRSTVAWALAMRANGAEPDGLRAAAASAGYDLSRLPL